MTKQQANKAFAEMLKAFPKTFGRVSFRERLMLRTAFTKAYCDLAIEGRDMKIDELEEQNSQMFNTIALQEQQIEKMKCCEICNHNKGGCSYHQNWTKECLENNHKYFELKENEK